MAKSRSKKKNAKLSKELIITLVVIVLIIAIVMAAIYFIRPDIFSLIISAITGNGRGQGGDIPTNEILGDRLEVHFIDVGQGDSIVIKFPDGKAMMIDAGGRYNTGHVDEGKKVKDEIIAYVKDVAKISVFDAVLLTHSDADHSDYVDDVIETFEVKKIFLPDYDGEIDGEGGSIPTKTFNDVVIAANKETYTDPDGNTRKAEVIKNVDTVNNISGNGYSMISYCRSAEYYDTVKKSSAQALNSVSPISVLTYGNRSVVFTGDAEGKGKNDTEHWFIDKKIDIDCDVLKVGHHGSESGTSADFLNYIDPEFAVISAGTGNSYGHPTPSTLDRLAAYRDAIPDGDYDGIKEIYRTDNDGDVVLTIGENGGMDFRTSRGEKSRVEVQFETERIIFWIDRRFPQAA